MLINKTFCDKLLLYSKEEKDEIRKYNKKNESRTESKTMCR